MNVTKRDLVSVRERGIWSSLCYGRRRTEGLRSTSVGAEQTSPGRLAPTGPRAPHDTTVVSFCFKFLSVLTKKDRTLSDSVLFVNSERGIWSTLPLRSAQDRGPPDLVRPTTPPWCRIASKFCFVVKQKKESFRIPFLF